MKHRIRGEFDVVMTPQAEQPGVGDPMVGRMSLDKRYRGDLSGVSKGQMLAVRTATKGSAGYVAMERAEGTLVVGGEPRAGSFVLQHSSTMARGVPTQSITVVPDSGTGQLAGLRGVMTIDIEAGKHFYNFEFAIENTAL